MVTENKTERMQQGERLEEAIAAMRVNRDVFFEDFGYKTRGSTIVSQIRRGRSGITRKMLRLIEKHWPQVNIDYLMNGRGEPLLPVRGTQSVKRYTPVHGLGIDLKPNSTMEKWTTTDMTIDIPKANAERWITVNTESMEPRFARGNFIGVRQVKDFDLVPFGEAHYLVTKEHHLLYYVRRSEQDGHFTLVPENPKFDQIELAKEQIIELFIVKAYLAFT
jgi:hypothetical protein